MSKTNQISAALEAFKAKTTLAPSELAAAAGIDLRYASKFVSYLRFYGHDLSCNKDGRSVVSYTYNGETANVKPLPSGRAKKAAAPKPSKAAKPAKAKPSKSTKQANKPVMTPEEIKKATAAIQKMRKPKDEVEATFGSSGNIASSFNVDPDWDSMDGVDVRSLVA